jgi:hypothetical protein
MAAIKIEEIASARALQHTKIIIITSWIRRISCSGL